MLRDRVSLRRARGVLGDNGTGSITHLLAWVYNVTGVVPLVDLEFACQEFSRLAKQHNLDCNKFKTRIQTSTNGESVIYMYGKTNKKLAKSAERTLEAFYVRSGARVLSARYPT